MYEKRNNFINKNRLKLKKMLENIKTAFKTFIFQMIRKNIHRNIAIPTTQKKELFE